MRLSSSLSVNPTGFYLPYRRLDASWFQENEMGIHLRAFLAILPPLLVAVAGLLMTSVSYCGLVVVALGVADTIGRYRDFRYISRNQYITGRLADFHGRSFCGRWLVSVAFAKVHISCQHPHIPPFHPAGPDHCRASGSITTTRYYNFKGYRWYHVLPDGFPSILLRRAFWRTLVRGHAPR